MKIKAAFQYRGLCEVATLETTYDNYVRDGIALTSERGLDGPPDFFILQRGRWLKLDEAGEIFNYEFCAADYCSAQAD